MCQRPTIIIICFILACLPLSGQQQYGDELMGELNQMVKEGNREAAVKKINTIIEEKYAEEDWRQLTWAFTCKSNLYMYMFSFQQDSVLSVYSEGLNLVSKDKSPQFYLDMLMARSEVYQSMHLFQKSLPGWQEALTITEPESKERSQVLQRISESMHWLNMDQDSIQAFSEEAVRIAYVLNDSMRIASAVEGLAIMSKYKGNYQSSIDQFIEALKFVKSDRKFVLKRIGILTKISNLFFETSDFDKAIDYGQQALEFAQEMRYKNSIADVQELLGTIFLSKGEFDLAKSYYLKSYKHFKNKPSANFKASSLLGLSDVSLKANQLDSARMYIETLEQIIPKASPFLKSHFFQVKGRESIALGNYSDARKHMLNAEAIAIESDFPKQHMRVLEDLQKIYREEGDYRNALFAIDKVIYYRDSLYSVRTQQIIQDNEARYKKAEQEKEINILESQNAMKDLAISARNRQLLIGGISLLGLIILASWVYRLYLQKKQTNALLEEKNQVINESLKEKEALLREIHHRVKNNLQMISSLLSLQSRSVDDQVAIDALQEGRNRVKSMALIHQNLYQDENLIGIDIKSYMEKLAQSLFQTYDIREGDIRFVTEIDEVKLDVEQVIPLGLIINELISNALKYAFDHQQSGEIKLIIQQKENDLFVQVKDNGVGLPAKFTLDESPSLGFKLIQIFSKKLKANLDIQSEGGTSISMHIPLSA